MTTPTTPSTTPAANPLLAALGRRRAPVTYGLLVLAALFAAVPVAVSIKYGLDYLVVSVWGGAMAVVAAAAAAWFWVRPPRLSDLDAARLLVLGVGGMAGLLTAILGAGLAWKWLPVILGGWETWQGPEGRKIWLSVLTFMVGLALMFSSLQLARAEERANPLMRRLLYGYNALFSCLLLLGILVVINALVYLPVRPFKSLSARYEWASSSMYSLSDQSVQILRSLDKPVKVYVLMPNGDPMYFQMRYLLNNAQAETDRLRVEFLSPDLNREQVGKLAQQYKFADRRGVLVVYGTDEQGDSQFIRYGELEEMTPMTMRGRSHRPAFLGESALMSAIKFLAAGKTKPVVYFTQGHGELDLDDTRPGEDGIGALKQRLETANYTVKGLQLTAVGASDKPDLVAAATVPEDATVVVIARPRERFAAAQLDALARFVEPAGADAARKKKGKLIVLLDVDVDPITNLPRETGLEKFLNRFHVQVGNDRILNLPTEANDGQPTVAMVHSNVRASENLIAQIFSRVGLIPFVNARTVQPMPPAGGQPPGPYKAETLFQTQARAAWAETNFRIDPERMMRELLLREEVGKRVSREPLSMAVAVTEPTGGTPGDPHAFMNQTQQPRLLVFGDADWVSNQYIGNRGSQLGLIYYGLFDSCLSWLGERPENIGIEPKRGDQFALTPGFNVWRMAWPPGLLAVIGIVGLGTSVWVVRRR